MIRAAQTFYDIQAVNYKSIILYVATGSLFMGSIVSYYGGVNNSDKTIVLIITLMLLNIFILRLKILHSILLTGVFFIIAAVGDFINFIVLMRLLNYTVSYVQNSVYLSLLCDATVILLMVFFTYLIKRNFFYYKMQNLRTISVDYKTVVFIVTALILIFLNFYFVFNSDYEDYRLNMIYSAVFFSFLIFGLIFIIVSNRLKIEEKENRQLRIYINTISELSDELRRFKHNHLNILHSLSGFIELRDWVRLENYVNELVCESKKLNKNNMAVLQEIKDAGLYGLFSSKISMAESRGIDVNLSVKDVIEETAIKKRDLYEVVGIYFDNAIEAVEELEEKRIMVELYRENGFVNIIIKNNIGNINFSVSDLNKKGYSTKGEGWGDGLWLADRILMSYRDVLYNTIVNNNFFIQELLVPVKKSRDGYG